LLKWIKRLLLALLVAVAAFIAVALTSGGRPFRWFGGAVSGISNDAGDTADLLRDATRDVQSASHTIRKAGERIKGFASETGGKASGLVNSAGEAAKSVKESATNLVKPDDKDQKTE